MIGLGSNRLSVCRRGGMSVTQAGRGGMEWLAGGRRPDWVTPYSAQATAALKAQFPTQWPTIRDYGFAHPEIVGYMNAYAPEDAKIAYSLVPTLGKDRKIVIPNAASSTGRNNKLYIDWIKMNQIGKVEMGIQRLTYTSGMGYLVVLANGMTPACGIGYNDMGATFSPALSGQNSWKKVVDQTITFTSSNTNRVAFFLYSANDTNWTDDGGCTYIKVYARDMTTLLIHLVPFKRDGKMYFLDLLATDDQTRTLLYSTSGSASPYEQITDKNTEAPYPS